MDPVLLLVVDDEASRLALERDVACRYSTDYRVIAGQPGEAALDLLRQFRDRDEVVALVIADGAVSAAGAVSLLAAARTLHPGAGRVLMTSHGHAEEAMLAVNETGIDRYLVKPLEPAEDRLYPIVDELLADWQARALLPYARVGSVMETEVAKIDPNASLRDAAAAVAATGAGDVMVVDGTGALLGVLSEGDILRNALPDFDEILHAGGTLYDAYQLFMGKSHELADRPITPLVIRDPLVLHPDDHVAKAAIVLIDRQIGRLPVVDNGRLVGTLSRANICQAVLGQS